MHIHRAGFRIIAIATCIFLILQFLIWRFLPLEGLRWILSVVVIVWFLANFYFFRIPKRKPTLGEDMIVAPADGTVVEIKETFETEYFKENRIQVSIFMSPMNVHANYCPIGGEVKLTAYHPGKFLVAWHPKSSVLNEHHTNVIRHERFGEILVRQIAGAFAKRIVNYLRVSESVAQNQELGFIKYGSRVDLFLPLNTEIRVQRRDKVKGRQTVIAVLKDQLTRT